MTVNFMFFSEFPFEDRPEGFLEEFTVLCTVYSFLRFLCIGWSARHGSESELIDACAAAFRLICHSNFGSRVMVTVKKLLADESSDIVRMLAL